MVALIKGTKAPALDLSALDGKRYNLQLAASSTGLVVLAFFKAGCPTCQFAMPFLERLHQNYPTVNIWGVCQDDMATGSRFCEQYGLTLPILLDEELEATVKFDLTNVPSIFLIDGNLSIQLTSIGFVRDEFEEINARLAQATKQTSKELFQTADNVPAMKPG